MSYTANYRVETTAKSFEIIEYLCEVGEAGVSEVSGELDMSKSIVHNHLSTLREMGYVRKTGDEYSLSLRFIELGVTVQNNSDLFYRVEQTASELASTFDTAVYLLERDGNDGVVTHAWGERDGDSSQIGRRQSLCDSVLGAALLSELPDTEREAIIEQSASEPQRARELLNRSSAHGPVRGQAAGSGSETVVATGIGTADTCGGAVGVRIPSGADESTVEAIEEAVHSLDADAADAQDDVADERQFTTMKHSWFSQ